MHVLTYKQKHIQKQKILFHELIMRYCWVVTTVPNSFIRGAKLLPQHIALFFIKSKRNYQTRALAIYFRKQNDNFSRQLKTEKLLDSAEIIYLTPSDNHWTIWPQRGAKVWILYVFYERLGKIRSLKFAEWVISVTYILSIVSWKVYFVN